MTFLYLAGALALVLVAIKWLRKPLNPKTSEITLWHYCGLVAMAFSAHLAARFCERTFGLRYEHMFFVFIVTPMVAMVGLLIYRVRKPYRKNPEDS